MEQLEISKLNYIINKLERLKKHLSVKSEISWGANWNAKFIDQTMDNFAPNKVDMISSRIISIELVSIQFTNSSSFNEFSVLPKIAIFQRRFWPKIDIIAIDSTTIPHVYTRNYSTAQLMKQRIFFIIGVYSNCFLSFNFRDKELWIF